MVSIVEYNQFIKSWEKYSTEFIDNITKELNLYSPILRKRQEIIQKKSKEYFNIFSAISDVYYRENFNSDILKLILDPHTEDIGDCIFLQQFFDTIELKNIEKRKFGDLKSVYVLREKQKIDLLIHNNEYAIIIESKINGAIDQPNQLVRYYRKVIEEDHLKVLKVVYLTLFPNKKPNFAYDPKHPVDGITDETEYTEYVNEINKKLLCMSAVSNNVKDKNKTLKDFLKKCHDNATNCLAKTVISQYEKLLEKTGGKILMCGAEKKLIREIYSSKDRINDALDFGEVWNNKDEILAEIYKEEFSKIYSDWEFIEKEFRFYKEILKDKLYLYYEPKDWNQIGFWGDKLSKQNTSKLKEILNKLKHKDLTIEGDIESTDDGFIYVSFIYNDETIDSYFNKIRKTIDELVEITEKESLHS